MYTRSWNPSIVRVHGHIWGRVEQAKLERAGSLALMSAGPDFAAQAAGVTPYGDFSVLDFLPWVGTGKLAIQAFRECTG